MLPQPRRGEKGLATRHDDLGPLRTDAHLAKLDKKTHPEAPESPPTTLHSEALGQNKPKAIRGGGCARHRR
ncbi:hypothetical protein [Prosthecobacter sp.]